MKNERINHRCVLIDMYISMDLILVQFNLCARATHTHTHTHTFSARINKKVFHMKETYYEN